MSCSEIEIMLARVRQLLNDSQSHLTAFTYNSHRNNRGPLPYAESLLIKRTDIRMKSAELLLKYLLQSKAEENLAKYVPKLPQLTRRNRSWWWAWLVRLEKELFGEKEFLGTARKTGSQYHEWSERKLATWQAELSHKSLRSTEALKLVFKFKANEHARVQASWKDCVERLSKVSFPRELLTLVVEATVKTRVPHWRIDESTSIANVVDKAFRQWPESFGSDMRSLVHQISSRAILQHSLITIPATFTLRFTLVTPLDVQGSEHLIRYLVLDLYTVPRDGAHNQELNRATQSMSSLRSLFPNLESCVFVVRLAHSGPSGQSLAHLTNASLACRNIKKIDNIITLERTLVEFIDAFLGRGPGKHKFIRFVHSDCGDRNHAAKGSLVSVSSEDFPDAVPLPGTITEGEHRWATDAERIFRKAY